jgi:hypothetical protein
MINQLTIRNEKYPKVIIIMLALIIRENKTTIPRPSQQKRQSMEIRIVN